MSIIDTLRSPFVNNETTASTQTVNNNNTFLVTKYITLLQQQGLAVNNLYTVNISVLDSLLKNDVINLSYVNQGDESEEIQNRGMFDGLFNSGNYTSKIKDLFGGPAKKAEEVSKTTSTMKNGQIVELLCTSTQIPFYKSKQGESFYNHVKHKFVIGMDTDPIKMTFYVDRKTCVMDFFTEWNKLLYNTPPTVDYENASFDKYQGWINYKDKYAANVITIKMINKTKDGNFSYFHGVDLHGAYPAYIEPINLSNGNTELIQLNVIFEYDTMEHYVYNLPIADDFPSIPKMITGNSILDIKNGVQQGISQITDLKDAAINNIRNVGSQISSVGNMISSAPNIVNTAKSMVGNSPVKNMINTAKNMFKF